ncbi:unnamed protein product [Penicillium salamii]|nr:unnamed protein product [Penicillium salamii]CAG8355573.1 unnamed protein product [Penicillium salamii]
MHDLNLTLTGMEPGSYSMMPSANQHPGFYTPNSGGMGAIFHNQAGDLHTPTGMYLTPGPQHQHSHGVGPFHPQLMPNLMPEINSYADQASYAPSAFINWDSGYDAMNYSADASSINDSQVETASQMTASTDVLAQITSDMSYASGEQFRFNVSLCAPTAMVRNLKEIPITYLNKGHAYNIFVVDSNPPMTNSEQIRYRTYVRVSFEEEEQRIKPSRCWQLWKAGRGTTEAHQRGGTLSAVEYVDPFQGGAEVHKRGQVQVESTSVDGFCVTWTANPATGTTDCNIPVRFNFLSTNFSHSKGVKEIPVRLCAKTEHLSTGENLGVPRDTELAYCKVKLFRDHGAERKLSKDVEHVNNAIGKLKKQVSQAEMGGGFAKRKRDNNASATAKGTNRPTRQSKNKRSRSMGSDDGLPVNIYLEDDLESKLAMMQEMFSSTRSVSIFGLRGDQADDPDLYPIRLSGASEFFESEIMSCQKNGDLKSAESMFPSPANTNSSNSPPSTSTKLAKRPIPIQRIPSGDQGSRGFLEAVGIDSAYRPLLESPPKPIACFYARFSATEKFRQDYYRAIYLSERTVQNLIKQISAKQQIKPVCIVRMIHVNQNGMRILVDDDVVREIPEGQDMVVDISETPGADDNNAMEIILTY